MAREATSSYYNSKVVNLPKDNADQLNNHLVEIVVTPSFT